MVSGSVVLRACGRIAMCYACHRASRFTRMSCGHYEVPDIYVGLCCGIARGKCQFRCGIDSRLCIHFYSPPELV